MVDEALVIGNVVYHIDRDGDTVTVPAGLLEELHEYKVKWEQLQEAVELLLDKPDVEDHWDNLWLVAGR